METKTLYIDVDPPEADRGAVRGGLMRFNAAQAPDEQYAPVALVLRDGAGEVKGGLLGSTYWSWLCIDIFWLAEEVRGAGWGSQLLQQAEQLALARGCTVAHLDTMSFQARPFYEKHGYTVFGMLEDPLYGYQRFYMQKKLR